MMGIYRGDNIEKMLENDENVLGISWELVIPRIGLAIDFGAG